MNHHSLSRPGFREDHCRLHLHRTLTVLIATGWR